MSQDMTINQLLTIQHEQSLQVQQHNAKAMGDIKGQLSGVKSALLTQGALANVSVFTGKESLREWLEEIEKCKKLHDLTDEGTGQLVWAKTKGTVSRLVGRKLDENANLPWKTLKEILEKEYGDTVDRQQAFTKLTRLRQGRTETMASYIERTYYMADQAYGPEWKTNDVLEEQLIAFFMEGLRDCNLKRVIYKKDIKDIDEAMSIAKADELSKKRFPVESGSSEQRGEPMEIDQHRRGGCFRCGGPHLQRECPRQPGVAKQVRTVNERGPNLGDRNSNRKEFTGGGRGGRSGKATEESVPSKRWNYHQPQNDERTKLTEDDRRYRRCFNCHQTGHFWSQCRTRPLN